MTRRELVSVAVAIELSAIGAVFAAFLLTSGVATPLERALAAYVRRGGQ